MVPAWRLDQPFDYLVPDKFRSKVRRGSLVRVPLGSRKVRGVVRSLSDAGEREGLEAIASVVLDVPVAPPPHDSLLDRVAERYVVPRARVFERAVPPRVRVADILLTDSSPRRIEAPPGYDGLDGLSRSIAEGSGGVWVWRCAPDEDRALLIAYLLGSMTEGGALVVVPEVRYAGGMLGRVAEIDPGCVRIDSVVEPSERSAGMLTIAREGGRRVGLGGRAGVLAPVADLRLIVVDEEHHPSLKEDRSPRYDARWVAVARARAERAVCVFVSPTPSLEATVPSSGGRWGSVIPSRDRARSARPLVLVAESPDAGLSPELHQAVRASLRAGKRAGLLVPGAGFSRVIWCVSCRRSVRCPTCEAGMSFDADARTITCSRCRSVLPAPDSCSHCGGTDFRYLGAGSQRVAAQIERIFPDASVVRIDPSAFDPAADTRRADIYVTTWIGTKPEVRPEVAVVGVLDADWLIHRPDLRAAEKAYHALSAMAAWAGPGGTLVIQTREPNHHCVQSVVRADHGFFVEREAAVRQDLGYPPFVELMKLRAGGPSAHEVLAEARSILGPADRVLGPIEVRLPDEPPSLEILIKTADAQGVASKLRGILPRVPKGTHLRVDVDPR